MYVKKIKKKNMYFLFLQKSIQLEKKINFIKKYIYLSLKK